MMATPPAGSEGTISKSSHGTINNSGIIAHTPQRKIIHIDMDGAP